MTPAQALLIALVLCLAGAAVTAVVAANRRLAGWLTFLVTTIASMFALFAAARSLIDGGTAPETFLRLPALGFALTLHVDGLTAVFIGLIASIALPATLFSIRYMDLYPDYGVRRYYSWLLVFIAAMYGLVSTTDMMWFFFIFWQLMTLPGFVMIRFEHRNAANRRAALKFLVMMQIACAVTMLGAGLLAAGTPTVGAGLRFDFETVSANLPALLEGHPGRVALAFALFLVGFGIKLGMWPFGQVWLPDAHPAAPSPMSALLSGVMLKTGVYGIMRYFLWLVPAEATGAYPMTTWGALLAGLGTVTLLTGTLQALRQEQTKRLLAFHSIGQVGYILLGIGACLAVLGLNDAALAPVATVAFMGALLHTVHHGTFKSLLFLNSGSMLLAAGTQDLNRLGGLLKWMPVTGITVLVASFSISGVPGFNGFLSKWTIYTGAIQGVPAGWWLPVCGVLAILTSAVTLASFIKFFGAGFLGRASETVTQAAAGRKRLEKDWTLLAPQLLLAATCVVFGLAPAVAFGLATRALNASREGLGETLAAAVRTAEGLPGMQAVLGGGAHLVPLAVLALLALLGLGGAMLARAGGSSRRTDSPWLTGYAQAGEANRFTAHGYYAEFKRWFRWIGGAPRSGGAGSPNLKEPDHP
ncbi:MAG: peroxiredoxin family protein [Verrucomicrobiales bacterium]|nr:peroxiredoxin family protein [Verrucomicrobiales bacterium]MCP5525955.1 peroxiredoxin family protein [Verrucomicrobiales bacterium]